MAVTESLAGIAPPRVSNRRVGLSATKRPSVDSGATSVIQPGGSVNDAKVVEAANRLGVAMVFTGVRHFRHG